MNRQVLFGLLSVFLLIIASTSVLAAESYTAQGAQTVTIPACTISQQTILITNTGTTAIKPSVSLDNAPDWVRLVGSTQLIVPQEQLAVTVFMDPPCGQELRKSIDVLVQNTETPKKLTQDIVVINPSNINVALTSQQVDTCPCSLASLPFSLSNPGVHRETYDISLSGNIPGTPAQSSITLFPGQSTTSEVFIESACDQYGIFDGDIVIEAQRSGWKYEVPIDAIINACYEFGIAAPTSLDVCQNQVVAQPFFVENLVERENAYTISLIGAPEGVELDGNRLELGPKQKGQATIIADGEQLGNGSFILEVTSDIGDLQAQQQIDVTQISCSEAQLAFNQQQVACQNTVTIPIVVQSRSGDQTFTLTIPQEPYLLLSQNVVTVGQGESQEIQLTVDATTLDTQQYSIPIIVTSNTSDSVAQYVLEVENLPVLECYETQLVSNVIRLADNQTRYNVTVQHIGVVPTTFTFSTNTTGVTVDPTNASLGPNQELNVGIQINNQTESFDFVIDNGALQSIVEVRTSQGSQVNLLLIVVLILLIILIILLVLVLVRQPSQREESTATKKKKIQKELDIQNVDDENSPVHWSRFIIFFVIALLIILLFLWLFLINVPETSQEENVTTVEDNQTSQEPLNQSEVVVVTNTTEQNQSAEVQDESCNLWCQVRNFFAPPVTEQNVTTNVSDAPVENQTDNKSVIDLFDELLGNTSTNESTEPVNVSEPTAEQQVQAFIQEANESGKLGGFRVQIIEGSIPIQINLSQYFSDMDNDTLIFTALPADNLDIVFEGGLATIEKNNDFVGLVNTSFIATDGQGGKTTSPEVTFALLPGEPQEQISQWGTWILIIAIILAVLILLFLAYRSEE